MNSTCHLIDAERRHIERPATFTIPTAADIAALRPGHYVKLCVEGWESPSGPKGERFWVKVTSAPRPGFTGVVEQSDMALSHLHGVRDGDRFTFYPCHVMDVWQGEK